MSFKKAIGRSIAEIKKGKEVYKLGGKEKPDFYIQRVGSSKTVGTVHDKIPEKGLKSTYIGVKVNKPYDPELVKIGFKGHKVSQSPELRGMGTAQQFVRSQDIQGMKFDYPSEGKKNKNAQRVLVSELEKLTQIKLKEIDQATKVNKLGKALVKQAKRPKGMLKKAGGGSGSGIRNQSGEYKIPMPKLTK